MTAAGATSKIETRREVARLAPPTINANVITLEVPVSALKYGGGPAIWNAGTSADLGSGWESIDSIAFRPFPVSAHSPETGKPVPATQKPLLDEHPGAVSGTE